jgi:hypothetical protein
MCLTHTYEGIIPPPQAGYDNGKTINLLVCLVTSLLPNILTENFHHISSVSPSKYFVVSWNRIWQPLFISLCIHCSWSHPSLQSLNHISVGHGWDTWIERCPLNWLLSKLFSLCECSDNTLKYVMTISAQILANLRTLCWVRLPVWSRIFTSPCRPDRLWGPPNLPSNGYRGPFPRGKEAGAWSWSLTFN